MSRWIEGGYGVATSSRLLKMIGLFCRISLFYRALLQKRPIILRRRLLVATPYERAGPRENIDIRNTLVRLHKIIGLFCKRAL